MAGRKSKVLLDSIDYEILSLLDNATRFYSVLDVAKEIGLTHQNAKAHLFKLIKAKLIYSYKGEYPKIQLMTLKSKVSEELFADNNIDISKKEREEINQEIREYSGFMKILEKIDDIESVKDTLASISMELNDVSGSEWRKKVQKPTK